MAVRKTTFQITVLRPDETPEGMPDELSLETLMLNLDDGADGDWLAGTFEIVKDELLPDDKVAEAEQEFGCDGTFYETLGYVQVAAEGDAKC